MSYDLLIHKPFKAEIREACNHNPRLMAGVYGQLYGELAENPNKYRHRIAPGFQHAFVYRIRLRDPVHPELRHLFTFLVEDQAAQGRFLITGFEHSVREF